MNIYLEESPKNNMNKEEVKEEKKIYEKAFAEQVDVLYRNLYISTPMNFLCATIVFVALYRIPHTYLLFYWFLAILSTSILRLAHTAIYLYDKKATKLRYYLFLLLTGITAIIWGMAGFILMADANSVERMVVIVIIAGLAAVGVQSLQASLASCLIYINLIILPAALWIFLQNNSSYTLLGISILLYLFFNILISVRQYWFMENTLKLKYENIDLAENLTEKNKKLVQINQEIREKESNLRLIHDNAPIGMAIVSLEGKWINVNNKLCQIVGYNKDELEQLTIQDITYKEDLESDLDYRAKLLSGRIKSYQTEKRYVKKNNKLVWMAINISLVRGEGDKPLYYISQIEDINERKQNETIISWLSEMNSMLQLCHDSGEAYNIISHTAFKIFPELSGGLAIFNNSTNMQETVGTWGTNPMLKLLFKTEDCWGFRTGNMYVVHDSKKDVLCHHFSQLSPSSYICLPLIVEGQMLGMLHFNALWDTAITSYEQQIIKNFSEITKLSLSNIQLKEALSEQAIHDTLTGLVNRRYLYDVLPQMLQQAIKSKQMLSLCMIDIDFFKRINDKYGHDAGDEVLKYMGAFLKENVRENDIACRFGGEEFVVVLIDSNLKNANKKMEDIRVKMANAKINILHHILTDITISIGIAEAPMHGKTITEILRAADFALYAAKDAGRNVIINFDMEQTKVNYNKSGSKN